MVKQYHAQNIPLPRVLVNIHKFVNHDKLKIIQALKKKKKVPCIMVAIKAEMQQ